MSANHNIPDTHRLKIDTTAIKGCSLWADARARLLRNWAAVTGMVVMVVIVLLSVFGPLLSPHPLDEVYWDYIGSPPDWDAGFFFGTDSNGRDLFVRTLVGGRVSLLVGMVATLVALVIGVSYGAVSGYAGGRTDQLMMRIVDILYSLPFMFFVILLMVYFGRNIVLIFVAIGTVEWLDMARIVRGQTLSLKRREFIEAAHACGVTNHRLVFRHIIPNLAGPVVVFMTLLVPKVILFESFLSFLGLGVQEPMTSWGVLISEGARQMESAPWMLFFPAIFLAMTLFSLNFIGDGIRDALDLTTADVNRRAPAVRAMPATPQQAMLAVHNLEVWFSTPDGEVRAVNGISLSVQPGETLGVVGESGSGKSQLFLGIMGLLAANGRIRGSVRFHGQELLGLKARGLDVIRGSKMTMIFQDPMTSLNPFLKVGTQLTEVLVRHWGWDKARARVRAVEMLRKVRIPDAERRLDQYPHEFSGGMRQRVIIAMSLLCRPHLLIADEPTTALDVTVQAQVLDLLNTLQRESNTAVVLITHDLGVVTELCDRVMVLYAGSVMETGVVRNIFYNPQHPYTAGLLASTPRLDERFHDELVTIPGQPPNLQQLPAVGCPFAHRCRYGFDRCRVETPVLRKIGDVPGHYKACHLDSLETAR